jgi:hypothetical protein
MPALGEITLHFGAAGEADEAPLRFMPGHINLLVGPNNAGKSLMLRELSGVNPREDRRRSRKTKYPATRVVAAVNWSEAFTRAIEQDILQRAFSDEELNWPELNEQPWPVLVPALEAAAKQLELLRDDLSLKLVKLIKASTNEGIARFIDQLDIDWKEGGALLILGAVGALAFTRFTRDFSSPAEAAPIAGEPRRPRSPLTEEHAAELQLVLECTWLDCQKVFASLGVDATDLTLDGLLDAKILGGGLLKKAADIPIVGRLIAQHPAVAQIPAPDAAAIRLFERYAIVGGWLLDSGPLEALLKTLRDAHTECSWANPEQRANLAKGVLYLDGLARLEMTRSVALRAFDEDADDAPPILSLLKNPEVMQRLRAVVASALGRHLVIDMATQAPQVIWRLADEKPDDGLENSFTSGANAYHGRAALLAERSDGIHAFIGMLAAIFAKATDLVFIDEPEAFLHPPLVRKLARQLVSIAKESDWQFFIATHSADLLESCAAVGADVNIIRLTHSGERSTARLLDSASLRQLALDPLLRAESTLAALFHEGAIICEAAADRVLYREVNERLLLSDDDGGLESCIFLNAQNWQTVGRMIAPLRKMGVAAAAVLDSDVLFGSELGTILDAAQVPKILRDSWLQLRSKLKETVGTRMQRPVNEIKLKGELIATFTSSEAKLFKTICASLAGYGIFLVPVGELENWLSALGLKRSNEKFKWLRQALDRMGIDPEAEGYARPTSDDIWQFVREINRWVLDPNRDGTSSAPHQDD